jgi:hypothetical protein
VPVLVNESSSEAGNPWGVSFLRMFDMTNDSALFRTASQLEVDDWTRHGNVFRRGIEVYLPLYEAKMVHHFDHRFGTYEGQTEAQARQNKLPELSDQQHADPAFMAFPEFWVPQAEVDERLRDRWNCGWFLGWRDITGTEKVRTVIASVIPRVAVGNQYPLMLLGHYELGGHLAANLSSFVLDYEARQKAGGTHMNYFILEQLPILPPKCYDARAPWSPDKTIADWMRPYVLELIFTAYDLEAFGVDLNWHGEPFLWEPGRRFLLRCEMDAAFFQLYGISREDAEYIMETFPIVRTNDETIHGEYRTKRVILEVYDRMQHSIATGVPYRTPLDPPPADPRVAHRSEEPRPA